MRWAAENLPPDLVSQVAQVTRIRDFGEKERWKRITKRRNKKLKKE